MIPFFLLIVQKSNPKEHFLDIDTN